MARDVFLRFSLFCAFVRTSLVSDIPRNIILWTDWIDTWRNCFSFAFVKWGRNGCLKISGSRIYCSQECSFHDYETTVDAPFQWHWKHLPFFAMNWHHSSRSHEVQSCWTPPLIVQCVWRVLLRAVWYCGVTRKITYLVLAGQVDGQCEADDQNPEICVPNWSPHAQILNNPVNDWSTEGLKLKLVWVKVN